MTRNDILNAYNVTPLGCITSPGQFEGEPVYAPYLWDLALNGSADDDNGEAYTFIITSEDRKEFPELVGITSVEVYQSDNGFVCTEPRR